MSEKKAEKAPKCPECGVTSSQFAAIGVCPNCLWEDQRGLKTLREKLYGKIERSFRVFDMPGTRLPGTECVDIGDIVDTCFTEIGQWLIDYDDSSVGELIQAQASNKETT